MIGPIVLDKALFVDENSFRWRKRRVFRLGTTIVNVCYESFFLSLFLYSPYIMGRNILWIWILIIHSKNNKACPILWKGYSQDHFGRSGFLEHCFFFHIFNHYAHDVHYHWLNIQPVMGKVITPESRCSGKSEKLK